jgi:hypothetical protein
MMFDMGDWNRIPARQCRAHKVSLTIKILDKNTQSSVWIKIPEVVPEEHKSKKKHLQGQ